LKAHVISLTLLKGHKRCKTGLGMAVKSPQTQLVVAKTCNTQPDPDVADMACAQAHASGEAPKNFNN